MGVWCAVAIGLVVFDRKPWSAPAPAPARTEPSIPRGEATPAAPAWFQSLRSPLRGAGVRSARLVSRGPPGSPGPCAWSQATRTAKIGGEIKEMVIIARNRKWSGLGPVRKDPSCSGGSFSSLCWQKRSGTSTAVRRRRSRGVGSGSSERGPFPREDLGGMPHGRYDGYGRLRTDGPPFDT